MPLVPEAQLLPLARRYQDAVIHLADATSEAVAQLWDASGAISTAAQTEFAARAALIVEAAQRQAAMLSDAYVRSYVALGRGAPLQLSSIDVAQIVANARNGVAGDVVYSRPTVSARIALSEGKTVDAAKALARTRAAAAADIDVKLAARRAANDSMVGAGVHFYRRVPDADACTYCVVASTQRYKTGDLMPLHEHCGCTVAPLFTGNERIIDKDLLARLKAASDKPDYWNDPTAIIAVRHHGELGPVLTKAGDRFTGPADIAA
jgi:hypothetical protein